MNLRSSGKQASKRCIDNSIVFSWQEWTGKVYNILKVHFVIRKTLYLCCIEFVHSPFCACVLFLMHHSRVFVLYFINPQSHKVGKKQDPTVLQNSSFLNPAFYSFIWVCIFPVGAKHKYKYCETPRLAESW